jgi:hypothetical protein
MQPDGAPARCLIERTPGDLAGALDRAKAETLAHDGVWEGDLEGGNYVLKTPLGSITGTYTVSSGTVAFAISGKPRLVPCSLIASVIDQFIAP